MPKHKRKSRSRIPWLFLLMVVFPTVSAGIYYYKFASDQFVSEAHFIIQGNNAPDVDFLGALTGIPSAGGGASDALIIKDYLESLNFLEDIKPELDVRKHYSYPLLDGYARLPDQADHQTLLEYWQQMSRINYDLSSGITTVEITAFDAQVSYELVRLALRESEKLVNELTDRLRSDAVKFAAEEAEKAKQELDEIRARTTAFREQQNALDPVQEATAEMSAEISSRLSRLSQLEGVVTQLNADLARAEAELADLRSYMRSDTLKVQAALRKVQSLRQQVNQAQQNAARQRQVLQQKTQAQTRRNQEGQSKAAEVARYAELQSELAFAEQLYTSKLAALEQARLEDERKQRYLTVTVEPMLPDVAVKPDGITGTLTMLLFSFLLWGISALSMAAIRDHIGWV